jgi:mono/diheme cytochrome c family protein
MQKSVRSRLMSGLRLSLVVWVIFVFVYQASGIWAVENPVEKPTGANIVSGSSDFFPQDDVAGKDADPAKLAAEARQIFNNYCFRCHRGEGSSAGGYRFNARDVASMIDEGTLDSGSVADSEVYNAMFRNRMPPRNQIGLPRPSAEEIDVVKRWIEAGAPEFPLPERRPFLELKHVVHSISEHYKSLTAEQRGNYRYFTIANLWNEPSVDDRQLRMTRAALSKAINSLSWQPRLVIPEAIDEQQTVFAVDIARLGWTREHWLAILEEYPYQVAVDSVVDSGRGEEVKQLRKIEEDMILLGGGDRSLRHIRADWFITIGLRPKLYHRLLYDLTLPVLQARASDANKPLNPKRMTDRDLEAQLGVDVAGNIFGRQVKVHRAGFTESGISGQNRMIERHAIPAGGYYWKSYDFLGNNSRAILTEFPLGPTRNAKDEFSFVHDGGEIIYSLPNGLQGYLLTTAAGDRLDAGPIEIVGDALKTSGNQLIVNGLSCVVCHRQGMVSPPADEVRLNAGAFGEEADRVRSLYAEPAEMETLVVADSERFQQALMPLLRKSFVAEDFESFADGIPLEPVGEVARWYLLEPMTLDTVAAELFHKDITSLRLQLQKDPRVRQIGLGTLRQANGSIKREAWHNIEGRSLMQSAAEVLGFAPQ